MSIAKVLGAASVSAGFFLSFLQRIPRMGIPEEEETPPKNKKKESIEEE